MSELDPAPAMDRLRQLLNGTPFSVVYWGQLYAKDRQRLYLFDLEALATAYLADHPAEPQADLPTHAQPR